MAIIYQLTNRLNGLIYVGCTSDIKRRMREHKYYMRRRTNDLYKAMRTYGFNAFELSIIEEVDDNIKFDREKYWIAKLGSMNPSIGYNRTIGGTGTIGYIFTEQDLKKKSENLKGKYKPSAEQIERVRNLNKGKHLSKEVREKISKAHIGKPSAFVGCHHTEDSKRLAINTKKERGVLKAVIGTNLETEEKLYFDSLADASRFILSFREGKYTTIISHIRNSIVGNYLSKSAYGYKWEYVERSNDYPDKE